MVQEEDCRHSLLEKDCKIFMILKWNDPAPSFVNKAFSVPSETSVSLGKSFSFSYLADSSLLKVRVTETEHNNNLKPSHIPELLYCHKPDEDLTYEKHEYYCYYSNSMYSMHIGHWLKSGCYVILPLAFPYSQRR